VDRPELYYRLYDVLRELAHRGTALACAAGGMGRRLAGDPDGARPGEATTPSLGPPSRASDASAGLPS
jgi:hypothetical protein